MNWRESSANPSKENTEGSCPGGRHVKRGEVSGEECSVEKGGDGVGEGENGYLWLPGPTLIGSGDGGVGGEEDGEVILDLIIAKLFHEEDLSGNGYDNGSNDLICILVDDDDDVLLLELEIS
ncbi:hypothetical protein Cni_G24877 [Canna indica]|uniref:Uncharacterized protein n=1 Tax=Canna indica TaxID=4628 RepID=A0AAQ3QPZ5_9LILI|nr:hypothetical protein Cni_G24877 [Canna indica]